LGGKNSVAGKVPGFGSITISGLYKHLVLHASVTLKKLDKIMEARTTADSKKNRRTRVLGWKADKNMGWYKNCVFIDEAGFNMHLRRNFGRSKRGMPAKTIFRFSSVWPFFSRSKYLV
jgi:hypothetical protein